MKNTGQHGITYRKGTDGNLYPVFEDARLARKPLGKYGELMKRYLQATDPIRYQKMLMNGELWPYLQKEDERGRQKYEAIVRELQRNVKIPDASEDFMAAIQSITQIENQADELVREELFPNPHN